MSNLGKGVGGGVKQEDLGVTVGVLAGKVRKGVKGDTGAVGIDHGRAIDDKPSRVGDLGKDVGGGVQQGNLVVEIWIAPGQIRRGFNDDAGAIRINREATKAATQWCSELCDLAEGPLGVAYEEGLWP